MIVYCEMYMDSQKIKIKKRQRLPGSLMKGGIPRNGCLKDERREKKEEKTPVSSSKSSLQVYFPYRLFYRIGI